MICKFETCIGCDSSELFGSSFFLSLHSFLLLSLKNNLKKGGTLKEVFENSKWHFLPLQIWSILFRVTLLSFFVLFYQNAGCTSLTSPSSVLSSSFPWREYLFWCYRESLPMFIAPGLSSKLHNLVSWKHLNFNMCNFLSHPSIGNYFLLWHNFWIPLFVFVVHFVTSTAEHRLWYI